MTVSLVGYTNAGKSTLMNALTGADVLAEDKLFATLDTRTRRWQLPGWGPVLLSDTVGFIRDLPHHLIASFKATLEEARQADLLLHVADASNPGGARPDRGGLRRARASWASRRRTRCWCSTRSTASTDPTRLDALRNRYPHAVPISAQHRRRPVAAGRRGERRPEPGFPRPRDRLRRRATAGCWPSSPSTARCSAARSPATARRSTAASPGTHLGRDPRGRPAVEVHPHARHGIVDSRRRSGRRSRRGRLTRDRRPDRSGTSARKYRRLMRRSPRRLPASSSPAPPAASAASWPWRFARRGARLLLSARREDLLRDAGRRVRTRSAAPPSIVAGDVTDAAVRAALVARAARALGRPRRAGQQRRRQRPRPLRRQRRADAPPRHGGQLLRRRRADAPRPPAAAPLTARTPAIVNIGSILGHRGLPLNSEYCRQQVRPARLERSAAGRAGRRRRSTCCWSAPARPTRSSSITSSPSERDLPWGKCEGDHRRRGRRADGAGAGTRPPRDLSQLARPGAGARQSLRAGLVDRVIKRMVGPHRPPGDKHPS